MAGSRLKASEKQDICKKLTTILKKRYKSSPPENDRSVLETMLHGIMLENATYHEAEAALERLFLEFHEDLNEIRVSTIAELQGVLEGISDPEWRALRARSLLQYVFEKHFEYRFDDLKRGTLDQASTELEEMPHLTTFVRLHTLQTVLGSHVVPLDRQMCRVLVWCGLADYEQTEEEISASMKAAVRKADVAEVCYLLRCLATDPEFKTTFVEIDPEEEFDPTSAHTRLKKLLENGDPKAVGAKKSSTAKGTGADSKPEPKKKAAKKTTSAKTAKKVDSKKTGTKKTVKKAAKKSSGSKKKTGSR